jgi:tetratricopeptide (TPR) repeat protein
MVDKTEEFLKKLAPCIERGELEACVEEAARLAGEMGIGAEELVNLSVDEIDARKYDFAYVLSLAAVQDLKGEKKAVTFSNAGLAAQSIGKLEEAEEFYKKAIEIDPNIAEAYYNYANLFEKLGRKLEAAEHYKKAIEIDPKYAWAHCNYGVLLVELDRKTEAEEHYKKAIAFDPKDALAHYNYANLLKELNRKTEAEEYYKKAIELDPKLAITHSNYAGLLRESERFYEAEKEIRIAQIGRASCRERVS